MFVCEISIDFNVGHISQAKRLHGEILEVLNKYAYLFDKMPTLEVFEDTVEERDDDDNDDDDDWNEYDRDEWEDEN